jgi:alpha-amylase
MGIKQDYTFLQVSDHFYYMSTKFLSDGEVHSYFNPYNSPYDAFINYMNVLSDFEIRVNASVRSSVDDDVARLSKIIKEKDMQLEKLEKRLTTKKPVAAAKKAETKEPVTIAKKAIPKKPAVVAKSAAPKKTPPEKKGPGGKKN